jgi:UDP-N-acetylmuramate: L-alanyl-gamma-D-glutamyl-meso-diaminopimelate ligase
VDALLGADSIVVAEVAKLEQVPIDERLDPARLLQDLKASGKPAEYLPTVDTIVDHVKKQAGGGDVVCVFSNGGFGGIHQKLLSALQFRR